MIIVVLNTKGVLSGFGFFFHSSRKLSEHFIAILVEKSVTEWVWSSGLVLGQDLHLGLFHSVIQMKFSGQNVNVVVGNEQKASENSAVFSSVQPSLLIGQICQLSAIKQPFYFFTARQCFNSLKAFCCGYKLKVWCSYDSIIFFFPSELDSSVFEIFPVQSCCRLRAHWKWAVEELVYLSHLISPGWFISPISPGWFIFPIFPRLVPCPDLELHSCSHHTPLLWNISPSPSALLCGAALGRVGMVRNGRGGIQGVLGTFLRNFSCAGTAGISGQPQGRFAGLLQGSPGHGVSWSLSLEGAPRPGCSQGLLGTPGPTLVSCRPWQGLGEHHGLMAQHWELSSMN